MRKIWVVKGETSGHLEGQPAGLTEWQFSDGPAGARGGSNDYTDLRKGLDEHRDCELVWDEDLLLRDVCQRQANYGLRFRETDYPNAEWMTVCLPSSLRGDGMLDSFGSASRVACVMLTGEARGRVMFRDLDTKVQVLALG